MKLKSTEIKSYRLEQLKRQDNLCALCGHEIHDDAVLDHDHKSGLVRKVLHRGCNSLEGKIVNNLARARMSHLQLREFCLNLVTYIESTHTDLVHPTHRTPEQRQALTKKRAARQRQARRNK